MVALTIGSLTNTSAAMKFIPFKISVWPKLGSKKHLTQWESPSPSFQQNVLHVSLVPRPRRLSGPRPHGPGWLADLAEAEPGHGAGRELCDVPGGSVSGRSGSPDAVTGLDCQHWMGESVAETSRFGSQKPSKTFKNHGVPQIHDEFSPIHHPSKIPSKLPSKLHLPFGKLTSSYGNHHFHR